jgi:NAD(P)-dependent dehydrogenase (short-subunit alcohol dehydrogenase family)
MNETETAMSEAKTDRSETEVALVVGGGPGVSASCARLFVREGMKVAVAARTPDKPVLQDLASEHGVKLYACDASNLEDVENLFSSVSDELGDPRLVVHNIDGRMRDIFRKGITDVDQKLVWQTMENGSFSAFLVAQQAAKRMLAHDIPEDGHRGTVIFTNASAAMKGYPRSGAFAMSCHAKSGLAQSMARELMPEGIHVVNVPIDAAIGWTREDGTRQHAMAGTSVNDDLAHPDYIAEAYLQLHRQHRSTWTNEVVLRPWVENW